MWPQPLHLLTKDSLLLSRCPSSLCLPPPPLPSGPPIMEVVLHQFRTISSLRVTLHHSLLIYLRRPKCTPPTPRHLITAPPHLQHNLDIPRSRLLFLSLSRILQGPLVLSGLTQIHPNITIPTSKLRATSVRLLRPRTRGSTNLHRTRATTKWGQAWATLSLGLNLLDLNMRPTPGLGLVLPLPQSHTLRSLVHSQCSLKTMMWKMKKHWLEREIRQ